MDKCVYLYANFEGKAGGDKDDFFQYQVIIMLNGKLQMLGKNQRVGEDFTFLLKKNYNIKKEL